MRFIIKYRNEYFIECKSLEEAKAEIKDIIESFIENAGYVPQIELFGKMAFEYEIEAEV